MKKTRLNIVFIFVLILSGILIYRFYHIQIVKGDYWSTQAESQQDIQDNLEGRRGNIFAYNEEEDRVPLAINRNWEKVYISPRTIIDKGENKEEIASSLSNLLNVQKEEVLARMEDKEDAFEVIKQRLSQEQVEEIKSWDYDGVHLKKERLRFYPQKHLASHVIGFVGGQDQGQYGLEGYYNDVLQGMEGIQEGWRSPTGQVITETSAQQGANIQTTIDYNVQFMAEKLLREAAEDYDISSGSIIVGDPADGAIIAMANYPTFDPNNYSQTDNLAVFQNEAIQHLYEPGSVFKPLTMAAALEEDAVAPEDTFYDKGHIEVSGHIIKNYNEKQWEKVTMTKIIQDSINTGIVHVQDQLGNEAFLDYLNKLGIFERTGIDLQGEVYSENSSFKEGYNINFANASFGQGIKMTPIQLLTAFMSLANGGQLLEPHVAKNFHPETKVKREIFSPETTSQVTSMLIKTVEDGNAYKTQIPGYHIAAKTGTAQVPWTDLGRKKSGYSDKTIQTAIGYGPALEAEFVMLVKLNHPNTKTAGQSAVPVFKELSEYIIDYKQIPPDY